MKSGGTISTLRPQTNATASWPPSSQVKTENHSHAYNNLGWTAGPSTGASNAAIDPESLKYMYNMQFQLAQQQQLYHEPEPEPEPAPDPYLGGFDNQVEYNDAFPEPEDQPAYGWGYDAVVPDMPGGFNPGMGYHAPPVPPQDFNDAAVPAIAGYEVRPNASACPSHPFFSIHG
jgi:hypothetical protein